MLHKKTACLSGAIVLFLLIFSGCYKTTTIVKNPANDITTEMSYAKDIQPIFDKSCAVSGCHLTGGKAPDLTTANSYKSLTLGNYVKAGDPDNSLLMLWLTGKKNPVMPIGSGPDAAINAKIYAWIKQGAKNN
ncbi:MAG: hypothetical protein RLZZ28_1541 [Bacteroidota bacterium]|jgi:hypothetical protein